MNAWRLRLAAMLLAGGGAATAGAGPPALTQTFQSAVLASPGMQPLTVNGVTTSFTYTDVSVGVGAVPAADYLWAFATLVNNSNVAGTVTWGAYHNYVPHAAVACNLFAPQTVAVAAGAGHGVSVLQLPTSAPPFSTHVDPRTGSNVAVALGSNDTLTFYATVASTASWFNVSLTATAYLGPKWLPPAPAAPALAAGAYESHAATVAFVPVTVASPAYAVLASIVALAPASPSWVQVVPPATSNATFAGLANGSFYLASVASSNVFGATPSPASAPALAVGVPPRPYVASVTTSGGSTLVTFAAGLAGTGGQAIDGYAVTYTDVNTSTTVYNVASPVTLYALDVGKTYQATVVVTNDGGAHWSPASLPLFFNTYTVPSAVASWRVSPAPAYAVLATLVPPAANGSAITSYRLSDVVTGSNAYAYAPFASGAVQVVAPALAPGSTHAFRVYATNAAGESPASAVSAAVVASDVPDAPAGFGVTYATSNVLAVAIAPDVASNCATVVAYKLVQVVGDAPGTATVYPAAPGAGVASLLAGLTLGTTYAFQACASNASGWSAPSALSACNVPYAPPVIYTWTAQPELSTVAVVVNVYAANGRPVTAWGASNLSSNLPEVDTFSGNMLIAITPGYVYNFVMRGSNAAGWGPYSQTLATMAGPIPGTVTGMTVAAGPCNVSVTLPAQGTGFVLPRLPVQAYTVESLESNVDPVTRLPSPVAAATWAPAGDVDTVPSSVVIGGLVPGVALDFVAFASNAMGRSCNVSAPVGPVVPYTVPARIAAWSVAPAASNVLAFAIVPPFWNWAPVAGYRLTEAVGDAVGATWLFPSSNGTLTPASGLTVGVPYAFTASASNAAGWGPESAPSACNVVYVPPGAVTAWTLTGSNACAIAVLTPPFWGGSPLLAYAASNLTTGAVTTSNAPSLTLVGLANGVTYAVAPAASNAAGWGPYAPACNVTPFTVPSPVTSWSVGYASPPSSLVAAVTSNFFDGGARVVAYVVREVAGDAVGATFVGGSNVVPLPGLTPGVAYAFAVAASNAAGLGAWSAPSAPLTPYALAGAVTSWTLAFGNACATAVLQPPAFDGGRPVLAYGVSNATGITTSNAWAPDAPGVVVVTGLANGASYAMWASASNAQGWAPYATPRVVTPCTVPAAPTFTAAQDVLALDFAATPPAGAAAGGAPVLAYQAVETGTANLAAAGKSAYTPVASTSNFKVAGLAANVSYGFAVRCCNVAGWSPLAAAAPLLQPLTIPAVIHAFVTEMATKSTILVDIQQPADNGWSNLAYRATPSSQKRYVVANGVGSNVPCPVSHAPTASGALVFALPDTFTPGVYGFTVAACNAAGYAPESAEATVAAYDVPGAVASNAWTVTLVGTNVAYAQVTTPPPDYLSPILGYGITEVTTGASNVYLSAPGAAVVASSPLAYGPTYYFFVAASNAAGWGPPSAVSPSGVHPFKAPDALTTGWTRYPFPAGASVAFTPMGATGASGPAPGALPLTYPWPWQSYDFAVSGTGVQSWAVPANGTYGFSVAGASSGTLLGAASSNRVGHGMVVTGQVALTVEDTLYFVVGQRGGSSALAPGGGGGTYVFKNGINPYSLLFVAGGGGAPGLGAASNASTAAMDASPTPFGHAGSNVGVPGTPVNAGGAVPFFGAGGAGGLVTTAAAFTKMVALSGDRAVSVSFQTFGSPALVAVGIGTTAAPPTSIVAVGPGAASPLAVAGLVAGVAKNFFVAASNPGVAIPVGAWSTDQFWRSPVTVAPSAAALTPAATVSGPGAAAVAFGALAFTPSSNPVDAYVVAPYPGPSAATVVAAGASAPLGVPGLVPGASYRFCVAACNAVTGVGAWSPPSAPVTAVGAPPSAATLGPVATTVNSNVIVVTFPSMLPQATPTAPVAGYALSTGATRTSVVATCASNVTFFGLSNLTPGQQYTYFVAASNATGVGAWSAGCSATTGVGVPMSAASTVLTFAPTAIGALTLSFLPLATNYSQPIATYVVSTAGTAASVTALFGGPPLTFAGLALGQAYTVYVAASNVAGLGGWSLPATATAITLPPYAGALAPVATPVAPGSIAVSFGALATSASNPVAAYWVATASNAASNVAAGPASPLVVSGLAPGTAYTFVVTTSNALGAGGWSSPCAATALAVPPSAASLAPTAAPWGPGGSNALAVSMASLAPFAAASNPVAGYVLALAAPSPSLATAVAASNVPVLVASGLTPGTAYAYAVAACNATGVGAWSQTVTAVTAVALPPSAASMAPQVSVAGSGALAVTFAPLTATVAQPIVAYALATSPPSAATVVATTPASTPAFALAGLTLGQSYVYAVAASNAVGLGAWSPATAPVTAITGPPSAASLTPVAVPVSPNTLSVSFAPLLATASNPVAGYVVTTTVLGVTTTLATGASSPIAVAFGSGGNGQTVTLNVAASNAVGVGAASAPASATVIDLPPSAASLTPAAAPVAVGALAVSFALLPDTAGHPITSYVVSTAASPSSIVASNTMSPITASGFALGATPSLVVAASNALGVGAWSPACTARVLGLPPSAAPLGPSLVASLAGDCTLSLAWNVAALTATASNPIAGYVVATASNAASNVGVGPAPPLTTAALPAGSNVTLWVAASNVCGLGAWSPPCGPTAVVGLPPSMAAIAPTSTPTGIGAVLVSFAPPAPVFGRPIAAYVVTSNGTTLANTVAVTPATTCNASFTSLTPGVPVTYTVAASNVLGVGAWSLPCATTAITVPPSMAGVTPTAAIGGPLAATLTFATVAPQTGMPIVGYVASSNGVLFASNTASFAGPTATLVVPALSAAKAYAFTVAASNAVGLGAPSAPCAPFTPIALPASAAAVTPTVTIAGDTALAVSFAALTPTVAAPIAGYVLSTSASMAPALATLAYPSTAITLTSANGIVADGLTAYRLYVAASNAAGLGAPSATPSPALFAMTRPPPMVTAPTMAFGGDRAIAVTVAPLAGTVASPVYGYAVSPDGLSVAATSTGTTVIARNLTPGTAYSFVSAASNVVGLGGWSMVPVSTFMALTTPPSLAAQTPTVGLGNLTATVSFTPLVSPAAGMPVAAYVLSATSNGAIVQTTPDAVTGTFATLTGLSAGTVYTYYVAASNVVGTGAWTQGTSVTAITTAYAPSLAVVPSTTQAATLVATVTPVPNTGPTNGYTPVTMYTVENASSSNVVGTTTNTTSSTSIAVSGLTPGVTYAYIAAATNVFGYGAWSTAQSAMAITTPQLTPTITSAVTSAGTITVTITNFGSYSPSSVASGYAACTFGVASSVNGTYLQTTTSSPFVLTGYAFVTGTYNLYCAVYNSIANSAVWSVNVPVNIVLPSAQNATATISLNSCTLSWTQSTLTGWNAVTGYTVSGSAITTQYLSSTTNTITLSSLQYTTGYTFTVTATSMVGTGSAVFNVTTNHVAPILNTISLTSGSPAYVQLTQTATNTGSLTWSVSYGGSSYYTLYTLSSGSTLSSYVTISTTGNLCINWGLLASDIMSGNYISAGTTETVYVNVYCTNPEGVSAHLTLSVIYTYITGLYGTYIPSYSVT